LTSSPVGWLSLLRCLCWRTCQGSGSVWCSVHIVLCSRRGPILAAGGDASGIWPIGAARTAVLAMLLIDRGRASGRPFSCAAAFARDRSANSAARLLLLWYAQVPWRYSPFDERGSLNQLLLFNGCCCLNHLSAPPGILAAAACAREPDTMQDARVVAANRGRRIAQLTFAPA
jgi:hypothetical protein